MKIAIIEDNREAGEALAGLLEEHEVRIFESLFEAIDYPADTVLIDVSAVSAGAWGAHTYSPICSYIDRHPGTKVVITSALPAHHFKAVADDVREVFPDALVEHRSFLGDLDWLEEL